MNALHAVGTSDPGADATVAQALPRSSGDSAPHRATALTRPKRSLLTWYFRKAAIDGMTDPLFLEVIVNPDVLPVERPAVLAHEWAHLAGYADESEANYIAWLACMRRYAAARYSGWLSAYQHPPGRCRARSANAACGIESRRRQRSGSRRPTVCPIQPTVRAAAQGAYDSYLRANRIEEGIANYNAVVRLMLGTTFDAQWTPQLRQQ